MLTPETAIWMLLTVMVDATDGKLSIKVLAQTCAESFPAAGAVFLEAC